jgi:hypothetical protein
MSLELINHVLNIDLTRDDSLYYGCGEDMGMECSMHRGVERINT